MGRASEPAERAPKPAGRASETGGRPRGMEEKRENGAFLVCGGTIGHHPLRGRCPKMEISGSVCSGAILSGAMANTSVFSQFVTFFRFNIFVPHPIFFLKLL